LRQSAGEASPAGAAIAAAEDFFRLWVRRFDRIQ
jgi:hypothetical protein